MEEKLRGLEGLKELTSIAALGHGAVIVEFETDVDTETASQEVREKVDQAKADLPSDDAKEPTINEVNFNLFPTLIVALVRRCAGADACTATPGRCRMSLKPSLRFWKPN